MVTVVTGEKEVRRALTQMRVSVQNRITRSAQRTSLSGLAKEIKSKLPGKYKEARRGIGSSLKKGIGGVHVGKAGVAVGIRGARRQKLADRASAQSGERKRKGVGISFNNIQWFIMGTKDRKLKKGSEQGPKAGHSTGSTKYDPQVRNIVAQAWASNQAQFAKTMQKRMAELVSREVAKIAVKGVSK